MAGPDTDGASATPERSAPATIYDIAERAGVSPSTVSRALNKPGRINPATVARVRDAAAALGYRSNPMARALPTGRTHTIALVLSDITNPVYFDLVRGAEATASSLGYTLILAESEESAAKEVETAQRLVPAVDGIIIVGSRAQDEELADIQRRKPLVVVNRLVAGVPSLVPDIVPGIRNALDHLQALGHTSLGYLAGPATSWMSAQRSTILLDEAPARGMTLAEIGPTAPTVEGGRTSLKRVRATGVTAVLAYNDLMAIGLLQACHSEGVSVPDYLSIIGFDDIFGSDFTSPTLTTIRTPLDTIGAAAARSLIEAEALDAGVLATEFVARESSATARK